MNTIGARIRTLREQKNLTQGDIAKYAKVSIASVSKWEKGQSEPKGENLSYISDILGVSMEYLISGNENVALTIDVNSGIPILGYTTAGAFKHVRELEPHEVEEYISSTLKQNGYRFALRINGQSMENPTGRQHIPDGCIVVFNADRRTPDNGDLVLAKVAGADEITFKKFVRDAGKVWLEPLNPRYPNITNEFRILATAEEMLQRL